MESASAAGARATALADPFGKALAARSGDSSPCRPIGVRDALVVVVPAWICSRLLAIVTLLIAQVVHHPALPRTGDGHPYSLWTWDGAWYLAIATHGYQGLHTEAVRFFPLFPLLGHVTGLLLGGHTGAGLVVVANTAALAFAAAVASFVHREIDPTLVRATVWLTLLAPGAIALALPYTEAVAGLLTVGYFLAVRGTRRGIWIALPLGVLAGLARPTGVLLSVVPLVELWQRRRRGLAPSLVAAAAAPIAGSALFCGWTYHGFGRAFLPYTAQTQHGLRGSVVADPLHSLLNPPAGAGLSPAADVTATAVALLLLALAWRTLPLSVWLWSALGVMSAVTSAHAMSLPRYLSAQFPLLIAGAALLRNRIALVAAVATSAAAFYAVGIKGFLGTGVL